MLKGNVFALNLNLTGIDPASLRKTLEPIAGIIAVEQTPPAPLIAYSDDPVTAIGASFVTFAAPDFQSTVWGYPSFWMVLSISPNLKIGANFTAYEWLGDNIQTVGPFISASWGDNKKSTNAGFHVLRLKGPDDFHINNIGIELSRNIRYSNWNVAIGYSAHFMQCVIHITDKPKSIDINLLRFSAYRIFQNNMQIGSEISLSRHLLSVQFLILKYF
ncbi:MAG: hypothetical protein KAU06_07660 [Candidatus Marinimicrobia bacterium]|nr:hypothetical protein [Candidatus Neomarinimicrobiota bacterium]